MPDSAITSEDDGQRTPLLGQRDHEDPGQPVSRSSMAGNHLLKWPRVLLTQIAGVVLLVLVLYMVVPNPAGLFSYHPPLQALSLVLFVQGILTLQPTRTKNEKETGLALHQYFQIAGSLAVIAGVSLMIINKAIHHAPHFTSYHGKFGLVTSILLLLQAVLGLLIAHPSGQNLLGGPGKAKAVWKYHRVSGYLILPLSLFTASLATYSADWVKGHSSMSMRVVMTAALGVVALGLWGGASLKKMGIKTA